MATSVQRTAAELLQDIADNIQVILRSEFRLAKAEIRDQISRVTSPAIMLTVGILIGIYGLSFLLLAVVIALAKVVPAWLEALIVGVPLSIVASILISSGRRGLTDIEPVPHKTVESLKENVQWAKEQMK